MSHPILSDVTSGCHIPVHGAAGQSDGDVDRAGRRHWEQRLPVVHPRIPQQWADDTSAGRRVLSSDVRLFFFSFHSFFFLSGGITRRMVRTPAGTFPLTDFIGKEQEYEQDKFIPAPVKKGSCAFGVEPVVFPLVMSFTAASFLHVLKHKEKKHSGGLASVQSLFLHHCLNTKNTGVILSFCF